MNEITRKFKSKVIVRGDMSLFTKGNAISFIQACKENNIGILGIDGFYLFGDKIQPSMDNSEDFSGYDYVSKTESIYTDAINFLNDRDEQLVFEIVTDSK